MAGLCGLIYILLESFFNTKITDRTELSSSTKNKIIASIPSAKESIISQNSNDLLNQAFRSLRTDLILTNNKIILITNSKAEKNNTNIALNTALSFTFLKKKVAFIDVINKIDDVKQYYKDNNYLNIFPIEESNTNISDLLASENFNNFIQNIQNEYDYIIINSTPIESDSFLILNKLANISLFICTKNVTERKKIRYLESLIDSNKINNIAIVMNGLSEQQML
jgi:Mrp family chromosome partitioning ATPase